MLQALLSKVSVREMSTLLRMHLQPIQWMVEYIPRMIKVRQMHFHPCSSFEVMISNGGTLPCKGKCRNVRISMADYNLCYEMFALPLGGCDVVLGAQWLHALGPILWDFAELWM